MNNLTFHHVGFAARDMEATIAEFEALGHVRQTEVIVDPVQGVQLCFLSLPGGAAIELVAPAGDSSPVDKYLRKNGNIAYHFCYETPDIQASIEWLQGRNYMLVLAPTPAIAFQNRPIAFLYNGDAGLIELLQA
jgi:methylmalonyl-CoA/ethylmalonyl-CoA epimerase